MSHKPADTVSGQLCAGAYCSRRRRARRPGLQLCAVCLREVICGLRQMAPLYQACGRLLSGGGQRSVRDKISGTMTPGMPFNGAAAETRAAILSVLASWSGLVTEERRITAPARTPTALTNFLLVHCEWLAAHEAAHELTREIRQLADAASRIAFPDGKHRICVGSCPEPDCGGSLYATIGQQDTLLPAEIGCDADSAHTWPARSWLSLGRQIGERPGHWLSVTDICRLRDIQPGNVYRLASERRWRRRRNAGHSYYYALDVEQTFGGSGNLGRQPG